MLPLGALGSPDLRGGLVAAVAGVCNLVFCPCPPPLSSPFHGADLQGKRWRPRVVLFQLFHPQDLGQGTFGAKEWEQPPCLEHPTPLLRGKEFPGGGSLCWGLLLQVLWWAATQMASAILLPGGHALASSSPLECG